MLSQRILSASAVSRLTWAFRWWLAVLRLTDVNLEQLAKML